MKAFIPISVSTKLFSTARLNDALPPLFTKYDHFVLLVADRLQMYNEASDPRKAEAEIYEYWATRPSPIFLERRKWLSRVMRDHDIPESKFDIISIDDAADGEMLRILRELYIFYNLNTQFHDDVEFAVISAVDRKSSYRDYDRACRLSRIYILEEIALNIRIRVRFQVFDEYYLGPQMEIFPELFLGNHAWFMHKIGLTSLYDIRMARFFWWEDQIGWQLYEVKKEESPF